MASQCQLCKSAQETAQHLLLECPFAQEVWKSMQAWFQISRLPRAITWQEILAWSKRSSFTKTGKQLIRHACLISDYQLWETRNPVLFERGGQSVRMVLNHIRQSLWESCLELKEGNRDVGVAQAWFYKLIGGGPSRSTGPDPSHATEE